MHSRTSSSTRLLRALPAVPALRAIPALFALLVIATSACDRSPVGPLDDADIAALAGTYEDAPGALTLSGLLYSAIRDVHAEQGVAAAGDLVRDLARIQHRLNGAAVEQRPSLRRELRQEQLRIVLLVHGSDVIAGTIRGVTDQAARLVQRRDALTASGIAAPEVSAAVQAVPALLDRARTAATEIEALDAVTRAAAATDRMRTALAGAARLPSLDEMFDAAASRLNAAASGLNAAASGLNAAASGVDPAAAGLDAGGPHPLVAESNALSDAAGDAVRSGERDSAHAATTAAREAQINVVLTALGPDVVADLIGSAQDRVAQQRNRLREAAAQRHITRLERMHETADDMLRRAESLLRTGDSADALDLAAHAVDLLNSVEMEITAR